LIAELQTELVVVAGASADDPHGGHRGYNHMFNSLWRERPQMALMVGIDAKSLKSIIKSRFENTKSNQQGIQQIYVEQELDRPVGIRHFGTNIGIFVWEHLGMFPKLTDQASRLRSRIWHFRNARSFMEASSQPWGGWCFWLLI
jgi:hypothetical protein